MGLNPRILGLALGVAGVLAPKLAAAQGLDVEGWLRRPGVKLVAVEFYATWCKPCMAAVPKWKALHDKYRQDGLRLVVIATQDADGACANPGWAPDEVICDDEGFLAERFGATTLPAAYLWGWQGHLLAKKAHVEEVEAQIERWMRRTPRVDVEVERVARGARISKRDLLSKLRAELNRSDKLTVVATAAERKKLRDIVRKSLSSSFADDKLACDATQEVSANSLLQATITGGKKKRLQLKLLSAERGCLVASGTTRWNPKKASVSIGEAVAKLAKRLRLVKTQYPWASGALTSRAPKGGQGTAPRAQEDSYEALLAKAEAAKKAAAEAEAAAKAQRVTRTKKLETAWAAVSRIAETKALSQQDRLGALARFTRDFPDDNPHLETAIEYVRRLESGEEPSAAPKGMVVVPGGDFYMGCNQRVDAECSYDEKPGKMVHVAEFRIDTTEVTVGEYKKCMDAGACSGDPSTQDVKGQDRACNWGKRDRANHPINCVNWASAEAYCKWTGKRLPSDKEWEKAARGTDGRKHAWGNTSVSCALAVFDEAARGCGRGSTWPVGSKSSGASPFGAQDMMGNVSEWTSDWHRRNRTRSLRGGAWINGPKYLRASERSGLRPAFRTGSVGFRCAQSD